MAPRSQNIQKLLDFFHLQRKLIISKTIQEVSKNKSKIKLTPSQWPLVMFLENNGASSIKDIARAFGTSSSAATQLVDSVIRNGYAQKKNDSRDRRLQIITLTPKAKRDMEKVRKNIEQLIISTFEKLSDQELEDYLRINKKIVASIPKKINNLK